MRITLSKTIIILLSVISTGCQTDKPDPLPQGPKYTIHLAIDRELVDEEDMPMTMAQSSPNDLYAVQVYRKSGSNYPRYAYGIFDNENTMKLELPGGATYKIEMTLVSNGAVTIARDINGGYLEPFNIGGFGSGGGKVTNEFTVATSTYMSKLSSGYATVNETGGTQAGYNRPPLSRFYGVTDNFTPTGDASLTIALKWVTFGLTVIPEDFNEGSIEIEMEGAPKLTLTPDNPTAITKKPFTFDHSLSSDDWTADSYSEDIPMSIVWFKGDGTRVVLRDKTAPTTFKRRVEKILRLPLGNSDGNKVVISKDDETFTGSEEEIIAP